MEVLNPWSGKMEAVEALDVEACADVMTPDLWRRQEPGDHEPGWSGTIMLLMMAGF